MTSAHLASLYRTFISLAVFAGTNSWETSRFAVGCVFRGKLRGTRFMLQWLKKHGGRYVTYSTIGGKTGSRTSDESKKLREAFHVIADAVIDEGCAPLYHNHYVGDYRLSKLLLEEDLELLDWSRWDLCVDTGHLVLALTDPVAFVTKWAEKVSWMHCKDVKTADLAALERPGVRWQDHFTPLGTGVVDFPKVLQALGDVGYKSWLVVEQDNSPDPYETSKVSIVYLRRVLTALEQPQVRSKAGS